MSQQRSNSRPHNSRPPLEWKVLSVYTGPEPVIDANMPEHVKEKARRRAACQVSIASAGFDHAKQVDRVKFSYKLGFEDQGQFTPTSFIPDERVTEFISALQAAAAESKVAHSNAVKSTKGQLAAKISESTKGLNRVAEAMRTKA